MIAFDEAFQWAEKVGIVACGIKLSVGFDFFPRSDFANGRRFLWKHEMSFWRIDDLRIEKIRRK